MMLHMAEIWAALAACFILGALVGSIFHRAIALTGAGRAQASLIQWIDRVVRALERVLMPWRGSVPAVLPQTVPVPPPDFSHVSDAPELHVAVEPYVPRHISVDPLPSGGLEEVELALVASPARPESTKSFEDMARGDLVGYRPLPLQAPRQGVADPLHLIAGLTRRHAGRLAEVGIFHFSQIASWTPQELAWVAAYLGVGDAIDDKDWVGQAMRFASADEPVRAPEPVPKTASAAKAKPARKRKAAKPAEEGGATEASAPAKRGAGKRASAVGPAAKAKPATKPKVAARSGPAKPRAGRKSKGAADSAASDIDPATTAPNKPPPGPRPETDVAPLAEPSTGAAPAGDDPADHRREP
jgi:predicted flap endonuclease-1-like 5' DNA nuclease